MNKIALIGILGASLLFVGCATTQNPEPEVDVVDTKTAINYSGTFTSVGVGPFVTKEKNAGEKTLVLRGWSHDVMVHIFVQENVYGKFFETEEEYLPGNKIQIAGLMVELPGMIGHRYFELRSAQTMKLIGYPDTEEVGDILSSYGSCQTDSDCVLMGAICPFDCYIGINKKLEEIALNVMGSYADRQGNDTCVYNCPYAEKAVCRYNSCIVSYGFDNDIPYQEGPAVERVAIACPDDLSKCSTESGPVCGQDNIDYDNECEACSAGLPVYVVGNCRKY